MNPKTRQQIIEKGREASMIEGAFAQLLQDQWSTTTSLLISAYRSGESTNRLFGLAGELAAIQSLLNTLENRQLRGENALKQEMDNAKDTAE